MPPRRRALPPLNALRAFEAFGRNGRMTGAAEELFVTHGAVSRQIRQLEQWYGAPLTQGPKTALRLTPDAERLLQAAVQAFDLIEAAAARPAPDSELRVACHGTFAIRWLIPRLPGFVERHPEIRLQVREMAGDAQLDGLEDVDAAIQLRSSGRRGEHQTPFLVNWYGPVLSAARWNAMERDPRRLLEAPRLHTRTWPQAWANWSRASGRALPPAAVERSFEHFSHALEAAAAGLGVAMAPWLFVADDVAAGRLAAPMGFIRLAGKMVLVRPAGRSRPGLDLLAEWLVEQGACMPQPPRGRAVRPGRGPFPSGSASGG